ncbi:conserved hypothetical protein [[Clostridium] ultunense Esp]|nr:conserved hypothetical protein [[Clostridium] ultunense Esp]
MPGGIRTPDLLIRSQTLYPAELRAHEVFELGKSRIDEMVPRTGLEPVR